MYINFQPNFVKSGVNPPAPSAGHVNPEEAYRQILQAEVDKIPEYLEQIEEAWLDYRENPTKENWEKYYILWG